MVRGSDLGGDAGEEGVEVGTEDNNGADDDDGDEADHEAVLNGGCATVTVDGGLETSESLEHEGAFRCKVEGVEVKAAGPGDLAS